MGYALPVTVQMTDMTCVECGIQYAVPETWRAEKQRNGERGHCPNGHGWRYSETDTDRLRKALSDEKQRHINTLARLNETEAKERNAQSAIKLMKNRAGAGVCPCCKRTVKQMAQHIKTKHPDYGAR